MVNKRPLVIDKIRVLLLAMLLLCGANVMSRGHIDSSHKNNPLSRDVPASATEISNGGLIAFAAADQIYVMNADGRDVRPVTDGAPGVANRYPTFSPDGSRLAFIRYESDSRKFSLSVIGIDGNDLQHLVSGYGTLGEPTWSPDGSRIAFVRGGDTTINGAAYLTSCGSQIYAVDVFTHKDTNLTRGAGGTDPSWSPDGTRIAFSSYRDGNYEIYSMDSNGNDIQRLTYTDWAEAEPSWSPDGKQIAYAAHLFQESVLCGFMPTGRPTGLDEEMLSIYVMTSEGANQTRLDLSSGGNEPTWSPDGTSLALVITDATEGSQIYVTDAEGLSLTRLTWDKTQNSSPSWSNFSR